MTIGTITKQLAGVEDLLLGTGSEVQTRGGAARNINKLTVATSVDNVTALRDVDPNKFPTAITYGQTTPGDNAGALYWFDSSSSLTDNGSTIISSNVEASGRWLSLVIFDGEIADEPKVFTDVATMKATELLPGQYAITQGYASATDGLSAAYRIASSGDGEALDNGNVAVYLSAEGIATVAALKLLNLPAGLRVQTKGYTTAGDGGQAEYLIKSAAQAATDGDVIDGYGNHTLANGNVAILQAKGLVDARTFGAVFDGVADIGPAVNAMLAAGLKVALPGLPYSVATTIDILDNSYIAAFGSRGVPAATTTEMFSANAVDDWVLDGFNEATGSGNGSSTGQTFLRVNGCRRYKVGAWTAKAMQGWGFRITHDGTTGERGEKGQFVGCAAYGNYVGYEIADGQSAEYNIFIGCNAVGNVTGVIQSAGNTNWVGGNIIDNTTTGVELQVGANSNHGIWSGVNINHNNTYNLLANDVANGHHFIGCNWYSNGGTTSKIQLNNSRGVHIQGGMWSCPYECNTGSGTTNGINTIRDMTVPSSGTSVATIGGTDLANVRSSGHYDFDGKRIELWIAEGSELVTIFTNGWQNFGASRNSAGYRKDENGIVFMQGIISSGTLTQPAFQLPVGYRPDKLLEMPVDANGAYGQVLIDTSGFVYPQVGSTTKFSLEGLSFNAKAP